MRLTPEAVLAEMGLTPRWREREAGWGILPPETTPTATPAPSRGAATARPPSGTPLSARGALPASPPNVVDAPARLSASDEVSATITNGATEVERMPVALGEDALPPADPARAVDLLEWPELEARVRDCRACGLCQQRRQAVLGVGDRQAEWLFIGEGPGAEEDVRGEPFVGQAGKLLDNMLAAIDLKRGENVYIANAVKCRPPGNRTPEPAEMAACRPYLARQIALIQPKIIVLLGKPAAHTMLGLDLQRPLGPLRGHRHEYEGIPVVVTYHPAYLLRNLPDKARAWEDLLYARRLHREATADQQQEALF